MRINLIVNPPDTVKPLAKTVAPKLVAFFPEWIRKYVGLLSRPLPCEC